MNSNYNVILESLQLLNKMADFATVNGLDQTNELAPVVGKPTSKHTGITLFPKFNLQLLIIINLFFSFIV